jgi:acetylornithine deacetylase/succinyl-diaminopimelate desuccinylase-like protein
MTATHHQPRRSTIRTERFTVTRQAAIDAAHAYADSGRLLADVTEGVRYRTVSAAPADSAEIRRYLDEYLVPRLRRMGFATRIEPNPASPAHPFLLAVREEKDAPFTVLTYGHADVQPAQEGQWRGGLDPWELVVEGDRWYGRGTADNKGQHSINLAALEQVIAARGGRLGYTVKAIFETGEESGSPGLSEACQRHADELAADVLIASDGPRISAPTPTMFLGSRGMSMLRLEVPLREGSYHSGNWGGLLANPATILANAIAALVNGRGRLLVGELKPEDIPASVRRAVARLTVGGEPGDPELSENWGEPGLTPEERVLAWNTLEVLDLLAGDPHQPVGAIPGTAAATVQLRFVVGTDEERIAEHVRAHLDRAGFGSVQVTELARMSATRLDPEDAWVKLTESSLRRTTGAEVAILPNLGGSLPNRAFAAGLGLPTVWVPHSYPGCAQHAPNEHQLASLSRDAMGLMAGLFWDLGEEGAQAAGRS